jgi:hypothetical protein
VGILLFLGNHKIVGKELALIPLGKVFEVASILAMTIS